MSSTPSLRTNRHRWIVAGIFITLAALAIAARRGPTVVRGTPILLDDFAFSLEAVRISPVEGPTSAQERFMIVTLRIDNRARRVSYRFIPGNSIVSDDSGAEYRIYPTEQRKLDESAPSRSAQQPPIPAGSAVTIDLVYRVPKDLAHPRLWISSGGPVGDFLESITAGTKAFDLEPLIESAVKRD